MGLKKQLLYAGGLALATGAPITFYSASDVADGVKQSLFGKPAAASAKQNPGSANASNAAASPASIDAQPAYAAAMKPTVTSSIGNLPMPSLQEVLRFNVTVEWVMHRWPRVSTGLPYLQLQGYRVPLVTGGGITDVAGSLTYYFNAQQQVQRITLRGTTGNPTSLVNVLTGQYHFSRRLTNDPGLIVYETVDSSDKSAGTLKIRSAKVVRADQPYTRFEFDLEMNRPDW